MTDMIKRVAVAIGCINPTNCFVETPVSECGCCQEAARRAIEAMRPEFDRISAAYSPRSDDVVWIDDQTPLPQFVDSIVNVIA